MVPDPRTLSGDSPAQEAGGVLSGPEVRGVFVREGEALAGVVTRGTLVRDVVAAGRDPSGTAVREIAEPPRHTLDPELPLDEAFRFLEEEDLERVPVTEQGRLVGVLSRSSLQRRLAEDEPPALDEDPGSVYYQQVWAPGGAAPSSGSGSSAASSAAPSRMSCSLASRPSRPKWSSTSPRIAVPATITGARSGSRAGTSRRSARGSDASRSSCVRTPKRESRWPCTWSGSSSERPRSSAAIEVIVPATPIAPVGLTSCGTCSANSSRAPAPHSASSSLVGGSECRKRSVMRTPPMFRLSWKLRPFGPPTTSSVEPPPMSIR